MKNPARYETVVELLELMLDSLHMPVDKIIHYYMKERTYIGAKDRRFIVDTFYKILRHSNKILRLAPNSPRLILAHYLIHFENFELKDLDTIFTGEEYELDYLRPAEKKKLSNEVVFDEYEMLNLPKRLVEFLKEDGIISDIESFSESLLDEAPLTLRVNKTKSNVEEITAQLEALQIPCSIGSHSDHAIICSKRFNLQETSFLKQGHVEVQDEGSQLMSLFCNVTEPMKVLDFCAGGGGKTLHLADLMNHKGQIFAHDIHTKRLQQLKKRAARAEIFNLQFIEDANERFQSRYQNYFDCVLVDAPCSGTGTWRRNPDMRVKFDKVNIDELAQLQLDILQQASIFVKPKGSLVYVTCSILKQENQSVIKKFLKNLDPDIMQFEINDSFHQKSTADLWKKLKAESQSEDSVGLNLFPHIHKTDGFYLCRLKRTV